MYKQDNNYRSYKLLMHKVQVCWILLAHTVTHDFKRVRKLVLVDFPHITRQRKEKGIVLILMKIFQAVAIAAGKKKNHAYTGKNC